MRLYGRHGVAVACEAPAFDLRHSLERITGTRHYGFAADVIQDSGTESLG